MLTGRLVRWIESKSLLQHQSSELEATKQLPTQNQAKGKMINDNSSSSDGSERGSSSDEEPEARERALAKKRTLENLQGVSNVGNKKNAIAQCERMLQGLSVGLTEICNS